MFTQTSIQLFEVDFSSLKILWTVPISRRNRNYWFYPCTFDYCHFFLQIVTEFWFIFSLTILYHVNLWINQPIETYQPRVEFGFIEAWKNQPSKNDSSMTWEPWHVLPTIHLVHKQKRWVHPNKTSLLVMINFERRLQQFCENFGFVEIFFFRNFHVKN